MNFYEYFNVNLEELYQMLSFYYFLTQLLFLGVDSWFSVLRRHGFSRSEEDVSENMVGLAGGVMVSLLAFR